MPSPVPPLAGVRVLDLTRLPPGAFCTVLLADLGADVVRVESPHGRPYEGPVGLHRGKRSVGLDLRHPRGSEILKALALHADVLIENERPGAMDERGFGYSHASAETPRLIWCSVSGFGQDGPYASWSGHDLAYAGHSGLLASLNPELPWHPQLILSIPAGALMATVGILAALRDRDRSGHGCQLDISLSESATWLLSSSDGILNGGPSGIPGGPDRHIYECAAGTWLVVTSAEPRTWAALCAGIGASDLVDTLHRWPDPDAVTDRLAGIFARRPAADWVAELGPLGAAVVQANRGHELAADPQVAHRRTLIDVGGRLVPRSPVRMRDREGERSTVKATPPPTLGADTAAVLAEVGFDPQSIAALFGEGVIGPARS